MRVANARHGDAGRHRLFLRVTVTVTTTTWSSAQTMEGIGRPCCMTGSSSDLRTGSYDYCCSRRPIRSPPAAVRLQRAAVGNFRPLARRMTQIGAGASTRISLKAAEDAGSQLTSPVFDPFPTESPTPGARRRNHCVIGDEQWTAAQHRRDGSSGESAASSRRRIDRTRRALGADLHHQTTNCGQICPRFPRRLVHSASARRTLLHPKHSRFQGACRAHSLPSGPASDRHSRLRVGFPVEHTGSSASSLVVRAGFDHHPWP